MTLRLARFEAAHAAAFDQVSVAMTAAELEELAAQPHSYSVFAGERLIASGGLLAATPLRAVAWAFLSREANAHALAIHRLARRGIEQSGFVRIEAYVDPRSAAAMRFVKLLGFTLDRPYWPLFLPNGAGAAQWAIYPKGR